MRLSILVVPLAAAVAACASPAQQAEQQERAVDEMMQIYGPACDKLGFSRNTDPWRNCIINLSQKDALRYSSSNYYGYPYWYNPYWGY